MKPKMLSLLISLFVLISCDKNDEGNAALYQTWEAKDFMSLESVAYPKAEGKKILLTFDKSGSFSLRLDINGCGGNFTVGENNRLEMTSPICTEICCDSKFSEKLVQTIPKVTSYNIEGAVLKLNVPQWGWIELELAD